MEGRYLRTLIDCDSDDLDKIIINPVVAMNGELSLTSFIVILGNYIVPSTSYSSSVGGTALLYYNEDVIGL